MMRFLALVWLCLSHLAMLVDAEKWKVVTLSSIEMIQHDADAE